LSLGLRRKANRFRHGEHGDTESTEKGKTKAKTINHRGTETQRHREKQEKNEDLFLTFSVSLWSMVLPFSFAGRGY
jgi:hypothetical protein